ncbi:hypothetical protein R3W88_010264 [Solanum pinnatisectum]|uniref:Uncharacterized protein n=1 Tax=Solanum pinnatisectum TaxID=50273 RepID=A0AAV9MEF1_9SOLN|nr:hypothetical protein R3W88_010264 [Solanum pinnatisectum]
MCYSGIPYWIDKRERYVHIAREQVPVQATAESTGSRGVVAGAGMAKQCICSPTIHPGSFRCRHHHADYKWVVPLGNKQNHFGASVAKAL